MLSDFGNERKALIFKEEGKDATRSYSSMRFARSSSEVIETKASRSSVGNWQRKLTAEPHSSPIFNNSSVTQEIPTDQTNSQKLKLLIGRVMKERELTRKSNGAGDGEDTRVAAEVTELAVGVAREDFAAVAAEEFDGGFGSVRSASDHAYWLARVWTLDRREMESNFGLEKERGEKML